MEKKRMTFRFGLISVMVFILSNLSAQTSFEGVQTLRNELTPLKYGTFKLFASKGLEKATAFRADEAVDMQNLTGDFVFSYLTSLSGMVDGMNGVTIKAKTDHTIVIENFWREGSIEANVDFKTKTISILPQKLGEHATFGDFEIRSYTTEGGVVTSNKTEPIVGTISTNGIKLSSAWGVFITSGDNAGKFFNLYSASAFEKANGKMSSLLRDNSITESPVIVRQLSGDSLEIRNFANYGETVYVDLHETGAISFMPQVAYRGTDAASKKVELYSYKVDFATTTFYKSERIRGIGLSRSFTWDNWFIASSDAKLVLSQYLSSTVTVDFDIQYPSFSFEGRGTEESPFRIKTKEDLIALSKITSEDNKDCYGMYFRMENDIDMELDENFMGISQDDNRKKSFAGVFDGNGRAIHRLKLNYVGWNGDQIAIAQCKSDAGFIGNLAVSGVVRNLIISSDSEILFWANSGAIVGYNSGTIENCRNYANIDGISCWIGGIAGANLGVIQNCYNVGKIRTGFNMAGGIAGQSKGGIIRNCQNDGNVSAEILSSFETSPSKIYAAGGIAGYSNGIIQNVVNTGTVKAPYRAGGIVAMCSPVGGIYRDVSCAVNYGSVFADSKSELGGIVGTEEKTGMYEDCYSDGQIVPYGGVNNKDAEGCQAVVTELLLNPISNFDQSVWDMKSGSYPVLKLFSTESVAVTARKTIARLASGETVANFKSQASLSSEEGLTWKLQNGSSYKITGNILSLNSSSVITKDTLVARLGNYSKVIPLMSIAEIPLQGMGTVEVPYQINTPEEWNVLAEYIKSSGIDFKGRYFILTSDLDFKEKEFQPIAIGDAVFQGNFDGNGKKIMNLDYDAGNKVENAYRALFGTVGPMGKLANLTFESGSVTGYSYMGGIVSDLYGMVSNCVNKATITTNGGPTVAGIVVYARGGAAVIRDCINYGSISTVEGKGYAAGILNSCDPGTVVENCTNYGKITANGNYAGGIVCYGYGPTVSGCHNLGEVTANGKYAGGIVAGLDAAISNIVNSSNKGAVSAKNNAGGILGQAYKPFVSESYIENCLNEGVIKTSDNYVAGIAGYVNKNLKVVNCYNTGEIMTEKAYAGGIVGQAATLSATQPVKISGSHNSGKVSSVTMNAGGIAADMMDYMTIDSCSNTGDIYTKKTAGGISSTIKNIHNDITNCWNAGNVTVEESVAGGILGAGIFAAPISGCFNVGTVKSTGEDAKTAYSIGGIAGTTKAVLTGCYNMGRIEGYKLIGGLVGSPAAGSLNASTGKITYGTSFTNCFNMGVISLKDTLGGSIVGNVTDYLFFEKVYATDQNFESDSVVTLLTEKDFAKLELGEGWKKVDYCYPYLNKLADNDYAPFFAVSFELAEGDTIDNVTQNFHIGVPERVTWKALTDNLKIEGCEVVVKPGAVNEEAILAAESGMLNKQIILLLNTPELPDKIGGNYLNKEVVREYYYGQDGVKVSNPADKGVYIKVITYDDGSMDVRKELK